MWYESVNPRTSVYDILDNFAEVQKSREQIKKKFYTVKYNILNLLLVFIPKVKLFIHLTFR